jgi:hypothetical protein
MAVEVGAQEPTMTTAQVEAVAVVLCHGLVLVLMPYRLRWTL